MGLGVTELSMSPRALAEASWLIRNTSQDDAKNLAKRILEMETDGEIRALLRENYSLKEQLIL
jgi:phosphoenolpyruvate-protein kinase (PTS system EI component)